MIFENYLAFFRRVRFYDFYCQFLIDATTHIIDCNEFDVKFIFYLLRKLKKLNYKLLILHENKLYYNQDIIYKLELPAQNLRSYYRLRIDNCGYKPSLWIIPEQSIK